MFEIFRRYSVILFAAAAFSAILLCGCRSDRYNQNQAAEAARSFLLKNAPELTASQVAYVKYNDPFLLTGDSFGDKAMGIKQVCIAWDIPGTNQIYMVFGVARERMDNWYPNRVIRKNYVKNAPEIGAAIEKSRAFAVTSFLETLSRSDLNIIRFSNPEIAVTDFSARLKESSNNPNDTSLNKFDVENLKSAAAQKTVQISLFWKISEGRCAIFCGPAANETLAGWDINFAGLMPEQQVKSAVRKTLKKPDSYNTPITVSAQKSVVNTEKSKR